MASNNHVAMCHPLPYGRRAATSKKDGGALEVKTDDYTAPAQGQRRDVGPAGPVTSVAIGPVQPSPLSRHHPGHCITIPHCGGTGRQDAATPAAVRHAASRQPHPLEPMYGQRPNRRPLQRHPRSRSWTDTGHAMTPRQIQNLPGRPSTP
jgi:hypothetical protein